MARWFFFAACLLTSGCSDLLGISDGTPRDDAGPNSTPSTKSGSLTCGAKTCNFAARESCCVGDDGVASCVSEAQGCPSLYIPCDRASQCAQGGDAGPIVCCADYETTDAGIVAMGVECLPASECNAANAGFTMCGGGSASSCPSGTTCGKSTVALPSFDVCLGNGVQ